MAEEPMLGLFDGETNFLDELAGTGSGDLGPPSGLDDGSMMGGPNTGMPPGMQQHMQQGQPQQGLIMGGQVSGAYQSNLNQDVSGYGMQISQSNMMGHQQYGGDQYGQYANSISKIGHNQGMMMGPGGGQSQQQGPFSPNMGGGMMQQQQTGYPGYNISGPHGHPQPQSMSQMSPMMSPSPGGWNQAQTSPNQQAQPHPHSQYMSPGGPQGQMSQYVNQGYHNQQIPQMNQYNPANKMAASSSAYIRPSNPMQGGMTSPPASMNLMGSMPVRSSHPGYPLHQATSASQHSAMMQGGYNTQLNQSMTGPNTSQYPSDIMSSHGPNQMSSGTMGQHYPQYSGNQQPRPDGPGGMSHYTTQAPTTGYGQPYPAMSQPRPGSSTPSPRPTPPPQSMTPNHSSSSQGTYGQSSLQQLEQLVSPGMPGSNPYQQLMQQNSTSPTGQLQQGPIYSSTNFPTTTVCSTVSQGGNVQASSGMVSNQGHMNMSGQMSMQNANNLVNYQNQMVQGSTAPMSPNQGMIPHGQTGIEIQRLEQQLQQLMSMPQTQQISQQMLEIQERLRMFRSQHQLHMQPQQHHQQMQQPRAKVHVQQQQGQMMSQQSQQMGQMRPMQGGIQSHIQPNHMNGQSALQHQHQQQQQGYPRGPSLSGQAGIPMSNSRSVPSPQKVQPFQSPTSTSQMDTSQQKPISKATLVSIQPADSLTIDSGPSFPDSLQMSPEDFHIPLLDQLTDQELSSTQDQAAGNKMMDMPRSHMSGGHIVVPSDSMPTTITEIAEAQEGQGEKPKRKRIRKPKAEKPPGEPGVEGEVDTTPKKKKERKPKEPKEPKPPKPPKAPKEPKPPKEPKEPKPKKPRVPKEPKPPKEPKVRAPRVRKKKAKEEEAPVEQVAAVEDGNSTIITSDTSVIGLDCSLDVSSQSIISVTDQGTETTPVEEAPDGLIERQKTPKTKKPRAPKTLKLKTPKKKKPPATLLLKSKKRKRNNSGSDVELNLNEVDTSTDLDPSVEKRRSSRNTKRTKYIDDIDLNLSDDDKHEDELGEAPVTMKKNTEEDTLIVDKVLGERIRRLDSDLEKPSEEVGTEGEVSEKKEGEKAEDGVEEFYVKYKNYSYLHCEWRTLAELERGDKRALSKIKRYRLKKAQSYFEEDEDELFNPDYVEVDRVLDMIVSKDPETEEETKHYLVKWRALSYEESTWELAQDVDPKKVEMFMRFREIPPEDQRKVFARPRPGQWRKLEETPVYKNDNTLREYQLEGVNWLTFCYYNGQNCILADEMGLGKTIQSITFLHEIYKYGIKGPFLVIVPLSTVGNWQREFETWTDMNVVVFHGTSISRNMIKEYELFYKDENGHRIPDIYRFEALITTFEIILTDFDLLADIDWRCAVIDEAHRLKNKNCRLLEGLRLFDLEHRVLLTGTPLQNNTEELYSLLNFLSPNKFNSAESFVKEFGDLKTEEQVDSLKEILKPMMLRRLKEDVEKNLAPKEETIIEVELTNIQKKYYRAILERNFQFLSKGTSSVPSLMNTMMELRKCCNHPYLINGAEDKILEEAREKNADDPDMMLNAMVQSSGKMVLMDKLMPRLKSSGHKVLIFSQMIRVLDIIEDYLIQKKYLYERLDGRIRGTVRQEAIDRFSKPESDRFAFLLCTRAGGLGINLTAADTVVIYDSDWNPQNDLQAQARCHRIGQSKAVKVYRLITRNSYEREMFDKASLKLGLDKAVLQSMGGDKPVNPATQMTKKEIEDLLKKGAYGALMEDDNTGDTFCEEDIDQILQRRTKVIQIESEGKGSTFAKASFTMTENRTDIDINDPNFWQKWAKKADIDTELSNKKTELILAEPRQRRQTNRYGNDEGTMEISDLDSSSGSEDEKGNKSKKMRKTRSQRRNQDEDLDYANDIPGDKYDRSECFKVEKLLLVYGWGRWSDLIKHAHFKRRLSEDDVIMIARSILAHSLKFYKGDDKIKNFIWDLISTGKEGELKNHSGLSAPVPRGRKGKKRKENLNFLEDQDKPLDFDPELVLDNGYKRHLHRHSNKVLLRVRLLYYIKQELIGEEAEKVFQNVPHTEISIPQPILEGEVPVPWWDEEADKSLIIGVFKYGYEKYNCIRSDASLCFLAKCGPPDGAALLAEQEDDKDDDDKEDDMTKDDMDDDENSQSSANEGKSCDRRASSRKNIEDGEEKSSDEKTLDSAPESSSEKKTSTSAEGDGDKLLFPDASSLNVRLRKCITNYQRHHKKRMLKNEQLQRKMERRERTDINLKEREYKRKEIQHSFRTHYSRWTRREEADFYRTVSTFGVEFSRAAGRFRWDRFREQARLDRKSDESLTEYFHAFYFMCQRVCGKLKPGDIPPNMIFVEPITEERASRCLARIDLLNKIRQDILMHTHLDERIKLCQHSYDMPSWWICGQHDKELLIGAARHGVAKTDFNILRDKTLSFHLVLENSLRSLRGHPAPMTPSQVSARAELFTSTPIAKYDRLEQLVKSPPMDQQDINKEKIKSEEEASSQGNASLSASETEVKKEANGTKGKLKAVKKEVKEVKNEKEPPVIKEEKETEIEEGSEAAGNTSEVKGEDKDTETSKYAEKHKEKESKDVGEEKGKSDEEKPEISKEEKDEDNPEKNSLQKPDKPDDQNKLIEEEDCSTSNISDKISTTDESQQSLLKPDTETKDDVDKATSDVKDDIEMPKLEPLKMGEDLPPVKLKLASPKTNEDVKKDRDTKEEEDVKDELEKIKELVAKTEEKETEDDNKPEYVKLKEKIIKTEIERINEERLRRERDAKGGDGDVSPFVGGPPGIFGDDPSVMEVEGLEPGEIAPTRYFGPAVEWPKDRVIFHRLEHICYTIEHGEWPFSRRPPQTFFPPGTPTHADSRSETPVSTAVKSDSATGAESDHSEGLPTAEPINQRNDSLKMTFHKRGRGRGRKYEIDPDKANRIQQLLNQSACGTLSSDDSQSDSFNLPNLSQGLGSSPVSTQPGHTQQRHLPTSPLVKSSSSHHLPQPQHMPSPLLNGAGSTDLEHSELRRRMMEQGLFIPDRKRRGRKRRSEKMAELAMAEALAKREQTRILSMLEPDTRIPMINLEDGSVLAEEDCPKKRDIEEWMQQHPGYMIDNSICLLDPYLPEVQASISSGKVGAASGFLSGSNRSSAASTSHGLPRTPVSSCTPGKAGEEDDANQVVLNTPEIGPETFVRRRGRKPQLDPRTLNLDRLTGEENVAVVERGSGKKITGSKAPPLKHLKEWLDQNSSFDVEPKWGDLVRAKGILPKSMDGRILKPSGRGRKPRDSLLHSQMMAGEMPFPPVSLAALSAYQGAAGLVGSFPKLPLGLPFGAMAGLPGLPNPLLGLQGLGLPNMGFPPHLVKAMEDELKEREKEFKEREEFKGREKESERANGGNKEGGAGEKSCRGSSSAKDDDGRLKKSESKTEKSSSATSLSSGSKSSSAETAHPSFPPFYFNPLLYNPLLANFPLPASLGAMLPPGLVLPPHSAPSPVNGQPESSKAEPSSSSSKHHHSSQHSHHNHSDKKRKHHHSHSDVPRTSPSIPQAHNAEDLSVKRHHASSISPPSPSLQAQDLSLRRSGEARPLPSSSPPPTANPTQEQATDLSMKAKATVNDKSSSHHSSKTLPSPLTSSSSPANLKVPNKNKIQGSLKLNRILDSLKDRVFKNDPVKEKSTNPTAESNGKEVLDNSKKSSTLERLPDTTESN